MVKNEDIMNAQGANSTRHVQSLFLPANTVLIVFICQVNINQVMNKNIVKKKLTGHSVQMCIMCKCANIEMGMLPYTYRYLCMLLQNCEHESETDCKGKSNNLKVLQASLSQANTALCLHSILHFATVLHRALAFISRTKFLSIQSANRN